MPSKILDKYVLHILIGLIEYILMQSIFHPYSFTFPSIAFYINLHDFQIIYFFEIWFKFGLRLKYLYFFNINHFQKLYKKCIVIDHLFLLCKNLVVSLNSKMKFRYSCSVSSSINSNKTCNQKSAHVPVSQLPPCKPQKDELNLGIEIKFKK